MSAPDPKRTSPEQWAATFLQDQTSCSACDGRVLGAPTALRDGMSLCAVCGTMLPSARKAENRKPSASQRTDWRPMMATPSATEAAEHERQFREILEYSPAALLIVDEDG